MLRTLLKLVVVVVVVIVVMARCGVSTPFSHFLAYCASFLQAYCHPLRKVHFLCDAMLFKLLQLSLSLFLKSK